MTRLTLVDTAFFALESPARPSHAGVLMLFDPPEGEAGPDFARRVVDTFRTIAPVAPFDRREVLLPALPAKGQWHQQITGPVGHRHLVLGRDMSSRFVLDRDIDGVPLRQELVQPEREERPAGTGMPRRRSSQQRRADRLLAFIDGGTGI
jgi:hypothetical protein